ncbi:FG-GAP-like repeat-containing protein [Halorubrum sp. DTA98]|uniref:FG-GAP-like repeat-containing protein n=1 Tax=Halorubrum sp. DTA98 TaxID=3402163 RepID=UPI003AAECCC7
MDRRVLFATLIVFAGGAAGVGVSVFAFVGLDDATADTEILWQSDPADGDDGSGAVVATVDGDPYVLQLAADRDAAGTAIRAIDADGTVAWTAPLPDGIDADGASDLVVGEFDGDPVVALTTHDGRLVARSAVDGAERFVVPIGGDGGLAPAFIDRTGDGTNALVAVHDAGGVIGVDAAGETTFETELDGDGALRPLAIAGDESATPDDTALTGVGIAVLTEDVDGQRVTVVDGSGDVVWTERTDGTALGWTAVDTRRGAVLALGGAGGTLTTLEAVDGSLRYEVGLQDVPVDVGAADAGRIHVGGTGDVWAVDSLDGEVVWKQQYGGETRVNAPAVGDLTGDGTPDVIAVNRGGELLGMNRNGEAVARGSVGDEVVYANPMAADLTGDGREEVLVVTERGSVIAVAT